MTDIDSRNPQISRWTLSRRKRCLDFVLALFATILLLPLLALVALSVLLGSGVPVLFRQVRCGRNAKPFRLLKFRSMRTGDNPGVGVTRSGDPRITQIGRFLRKSKLDELPQLFNVVGGELSLIGPRPELPAYIEALGSSGESLMRLKPGITGWATLHYRNEEQLLASISPDQVQEYYTRVLLPAKLTLDLEYAARATMLSDLSLLCRTCMTVLLGKSTSSHCLAAAAGSTESRT